MTHIQIIEKLGALLAYTALLGTLVASLAIYVKTKNIGSLLMAAGLITIAIGALLRTLGPDVTFISAINGPALSPHSSWYMFAAKELTMPAGMFITMLGFVVLSKLKGPPVKGAK